jgi:NADH-quinone oxidoreductase subunit F
MEQQEFRVLTRDINLEGFTGIDIYLYSGGYRALRKALREMKPDEIVEEVKKSNLRGLGGAGFPTGVKWTFLPKETDKPKYLAVNVDEGEPGTFKDRYLLLNNPHLFLEGIIITCYALNIHTAYIYIRGEYVKPTRVLEKAIAEAHREDILGKNIYGKGFDLELVIYKGAGAYICGEETAMLESLEGKKGWPRLKPPFPAVRGLYDCPTLVNNVETLCFIPTIIDMGGEAFAKMGKGKSGGTRLFSVSGHVKSPGLYELPLGIPLRKIIYEYAGGIRDDNKIKAVIPGGSSSPVLSADEIDVNMDFDSIARVGSMLGSGAVIVMDEYTCMVEALLILTRFYAHESCGQCTPCREGCGWMEKVLTRIIQGGGREQDIDNLLRIAGNILGNTICPLGDAAALPVQSFINKFRDEFEYYVREKKSKIENRHPLVLFS